MDTLTDMGKLKKVYNLLEDEISKEIFKNRLLFNITGDENYKHKIVCTNDNAKVLYERMCNSRQRKVIFGAGEMGRVLLTAFKNITFECFADNKLAGENYHGLPIISVNELKEHYQDALVIIATTKYHKEVLEQLIAEGFEESNIVNIGAEADDMMRNQYFDLPQLKSIINKREVFVDGGCFDGLTSIEFSKWCKENGSSEGKVYAWEPDPDNHVRCKKTLEKYDVDYVLVKSGLGKEREELSFIMNGMGSRVGEKGNIKIQIDSIDNVIKEPVTFIKMDIEGSEYNALLGAKRVISEDKPRLAICVYHKPEDIVELPWLIHQLNPQYKFYLRHYSFFHEETVLYAV